MRCYGYLPLAGLIFLWSCHAFQSSKDTAKDSHQPPKDNYIVLLDLGDRILFNNEQQVPKDIAVIKSVYSIFKANLALKDTSKKYYTLNDKIKLIGAPNWFFASVDLAAEQPDKKTTMPDKMEKVFNTLLPEIYTGAITGNKSTGYAGAGIWKYFNENLADDLDNNAQNTLFIITDGYMRAKETGDAPAKNNRYASCTQIVDALQYNPGWEATFAKGDYGLLPVEKKFSNLRVIVLEVNPKEGWSGEYQLLAKIWQKWFTEMGISNYTLIKNDSTSLVKESLAKLMHVRIDTAATAEQWTQISTFDSSSSTAIVPAMKTMDTVKSTAVPNGAAVAEKTNTVSTTNKKIDNTMKPPPLPVVAAPRKKTVSTPEVLPPDESDAQILGTKKPGSPAPKKPALQNNGDDILQDNGAANGFNTGIKKDNKKKNP